jgi:hypothetical protein
MIDPGGVTLGIAGLFSTAVEVVDRISAAKYYGEDYQLFVTKVVTERMRLSRWGQAVELAQGVRSEVDGESSQNHDSRIQQQHGLLQDLEIRNAVTELLAWAVRYFEDTEAVLKRNAVGGRRGGSSHFCRDEAVRKYLLLPDQWFRRSVTATLGLEIIKGKRLRSAK